MRLRYRRVVVHDPFHDWLDAYFAAWVSNDPDEVAALFTEGAVYAVGPFAEPWIGREEIVRRWTAARQTDVAWTYEVLAFDQAEGEGIAHWRVAARDDDGVRRERDGILWLRFAPDGRCSEHREWVATRDLPERA